MKKAQILSAIALAFALGVVAPVAGLATNVSAYNTENSTATLTDVNNAIAYVENNTTYKNYVAIQNAIRQYNVSVTTGLVDDLDPAASDPTLADQAEKVYAKVQAAARTTGNYFDYNTTNIQNSILELNGFKAQIEKAISLAEASNLYAKLSPIINLVKNGADTAANDTKLVNALHALRTYVGPTGINIISYADFDAMHPEQATVVKFRANNPLTDTTTYASFAKLNYAAAQDVFNAITDANKALAKYNAGYALFMPLLTQSGLLTQLGQNWLDTHANVQPSDLFNLASGDLIRNTEWKALYEEVQQAKEDRVLEESGDNYDVIYQLALAWQGATGNEQKTATVMATMVAYKAPANTDEGNTQPGTNVPNPGNTGIVGSAEGTAATTVSIVAGLATALTALGAGVVAYRSARREK